MKKPALVAATALLAGFLTQIGVLPAHAGTRRPNIVVFMLDDQRYDKVTREYMPHVYRDLFRNQNTTVFKQSFVPDPLCCPSRVTILTGTNAWTNDTWDNQGDHGGWRNFHQQTVPGGNGRLENDTIARDLHRDGYRTAMIGKYMNGYDGGVQRFVPKGWDHWFALSSGAYYDYGVTTKRKMLSFGARPRDYASRVLGRDAMSFVRGGGPFFLYLSFTAPHGPATPDPHDVARFDDTSDCDLCDSMLDAAYGADRQIGRVVEALGSLSRPTVVVYLSDNGYLWHERKGDWGGLLGKRWPYDESIRIPMSITAPGVVAGAQDLVLNLDLRQTLDAAAGVTAPAYTEGLDWLDPAYVPRDRFVIYHQQSRDLGTKSVPTYCGVRTATRLWVRYLFDGAYHEETYLEPDEQHQVDDPTFAADSASFARQQGCTPPGYGWP